MERGTIEILTQGRNPGGERLMVNGYGTGEFEDVRITALTYTPLMPNPDYGEPGEPEYLLVVDRAGTVMGWPT